MTWVGAREYFKLYGLKQNNLLAAMDKAREFEKSLKEKRTKYVPRKFTFESPKELDLVLLKL